MRRGKKQNYNKNHRAWSEWMQGKRLGRKKQIWVVDGALSGHWAKI